MYASEIITEKSYKHVQDPNRLSHALCGIPLIEVYMWSNPNAPLCSCPHCSKELRSKSSVENMTPAEHIDIVINLPSVPWYKRLWYKFCDAVYDAMK